MSVEVIEDAATVNILEWVEKAEADPELLMERQVTEVVLAAIGLSDQFGERIFLKGGILMGVLYASERNTGDIDFTTDLHPEKQLPAALEGELNRTLPQACAKLGYTDLLCQVQSVKIRPRKDTFAESSFPALEVRIGYAERGSAQEARYHQKASTSVVYADISFNEPISGVQVVKLDEEEALEIRAYSLKDLIAEKLRALLQQPIRKRNRRQDVYDIDHLIQGFPLLEDEKQGLLEALREKCAARGIDPREESLSDDEVKERARAEWDTLAQEIGEEGLPDFDECFARVDEFYRSLPW